jgi:hypothetical protein
MDPKQLLIEDDDTMNPLHVFQEVIENLVELQHASAGTQFVGNVASFVKNQHS